MINAAWILVILFGIAGSTAILMRKRIELVFAFAIFAIIFVLYGFALAGFPVAGYKAVCAVGVCAAAGCLLLLIRRKNWRYVFTPGAFAFALMVVVAWLAHRNQVYVHQDEFSHWGLACNRLYKLEKLPHIMRGVLMHPAYPPGSTLFCTFYTWLGGAFSEGSTMTANNLMLMACMVPIMQWADWKNWKRIVPLLFICLLIPIAFYSDAYQDVYVDIVIGCIAAYALILWFTVQNDWMTVVLAGSAVMVLPLMKESGTALALFVLVLMAWDHLKTKNSSWKKLAVMAAGMFAALFSWKLVCNVNYIGADKAFRSDEIVENIGYMLHGNAPWELNYLRQNFFRYLTMPIMMGEGNILELSYVAWILVFTAVGFWLERRETENGSLKTSSGRVIWRMIAVTAFYAVALFHLYLYNFSRKEAAGLHSFDRYMATIMTLTLAVTIALVLKNLQRKPLKMIPGTLAVAMALVLISNPYYLVELTFAAPMHTEQAQTKRADMLPPDFLLDYVEPDDRIAWLANDEERGNWLPFIQTNYELAPVRVHSPFDVLIDENTTVEMISDVLVESEWEYVYWFSMLEGSAEQYKELFVEQDQDQITGSTLYKVVSDGETAKLQRVY